jgi:hypothetical protein
MESGSDLNTGINGGNTAEEIAKMAAKTGFIVEEIPMIGTSAATVMLLSLK